MDPSHKARKNPSNNADLGFQAVGPALRIIQQQKVTSYIHWQRSITLSDVICLHETYVNEGTISWLTSYGS